MASTDKIAMIAAEDNSLIVEGMNLSHFDTLKGRGFKEAKNEFLRLINYSNTNDQNIYHWPCGNADLAIVDFKSLEYDIVANFFTEDPNLIPLNIKSSQNGRKLVALTCSKKNGATSIIYWNKVQNEENAITIKPCKTIDSKIAVGMYLEVTNAGDLVVLAGSSTNQENYLAAFSFDEHCDSVTKVKVRDEAIRGFSKFPNEDIFVVAGINSIHFYYLSNKVFYRLNSIPDVITGQIEMITICRDQTILVLPGEESTEIVTLKLAQKL